MDKQNWYIDSEKRSITYECDFYYDYYRSPETAELVRMFSQVTSFANKVVGELVSSSISFARVVIYNLEYQAYTDSFVGGFRIEMSDKDLTLFILKFGYGTKK